MQTMAVGRWSLMFGLLTGGAVLVAQQPPPQPSEQAVVPFSDPSRPGTIKVDLIEGSVTVHAEDRKDVSIGATGRDGRGRGGRGQQPDNNSGGLRRLTPAAGFEVTEDHNEVAIESSSPNRRLDFDIRVPIRVNVRAETVNGGAIVIDGVDGEIEANNVNGSITLTKVSGSVVANTVNGKVLVSLARVTAGKAMAFTSLNGSVDVTLPASAKANLKLRSDMGDIFTDFDVQLRAAAAPTASAGRRGNGPIRLNVNNTVTGTINGGGAEFELRTFNGNVYLRKGN